MKLSLFSQIVKNGEDSDLVFNGGEMRNKLFDVRIEGTLKLTSDYKDCLCLLSLNPLGCMVYLIRPLFSRMGDYRALVVRCRNRLACHHQGCKPCVGQR